MKRRLSITIALLMIISLTGCTQKISADGTNQLVETQSSAEVLVSSDNANSDKKKSAKDINNYTYEKPIERKLNEDLILSIDPKIESAYMVIEMVSDETGFTQYDDSNYMNEQIEAFKDYKDHKVFDIARDMVSKEYSYDAISSSLYYFDDNGVLIDEIIIDEDVVNRAGGMDKLKEFVTALYDFRKISDYDSYFISNSDFYKREMAFAANYIESGGIYNAYKEHYGSLAGDIRIVITPECFCGYGNTIEYPDHIILMPTLNVIKDEERYAEFLLHEFSHPYVNPNTDKRIDIVNKQSQLYEPISSVMTDMAYNTWKICLDEHIVRANTAYMIYKLYGEETNNELLDWEEKSGFVYIRPIYDSIVRYEENRDQYKDFSQYFDVLMDEIMELEPVNQ